MSWRPWKLNAHRVPASGGRPAVRAIVIAGMAAAACAQPLTAIADDATGLVVLVEAAAAPGAPAPPAERASAPGFLAAVPGVSLRSQGYDTPQADLSIRGAPFSSSGLLLAGLPLANPQTEHFQCDLPVPADVFAAPQLLTGLDQFRQSAGHPAGSVGLDFAPIGGASRAETGGGAGEQFANIRLCNTEALDARTVLGASAFADWASVDRTDGYDDNYLNRASAGAQAQARREQGEFDLLGAYGVRQFGARGFYGAPASLPAEERVAETLVVGGATFAEGPEDTPGHVTAAWQQVDDDYWLNRTNHDWYANRTLSDVASLHGDACLQADRELAVDLRADAREEWVDGVHTGTYAAPGLGTHARGCASVAAVPRYTLDAVTFSAGGSAEAFTDGRAAWLPAAGVAWQVNPNRKLALAFTEAVREPSYTELNYNSPGSLGNAGLERQETRTLDLSWREKAPEAEGGIAVFAQDGSEMVDWVRQTASSTAWVATNLVHVETLGLLADAAIPVTSGTDLTGSYLALAKASGTGVYASRYVLDYPRHTLRAGVRTRLTSEITLSVQQEAAAYRDNPARAGTDLSLGACAEVRWRVWRRARLEVAAGVYNPWNNRFETYPGQPAAGTRGSLSASRTW